MYALLACTHYLISNNSSARAYTYIYMLYMQLARPQMLVDVLLSRSARHTHQLLAHADGQRHRALEASLRSHINIHAHMCLAYLFIFLLFKQGYKILDITYKYTHM